MTLPLNDLPDGWTRTTLGDVTAQKIKQGDPPSGSFTYIDIASVDNICKQVTDAKVIPSEKAPSRARQHVEPGDVLVSMTRPNLNAVAKVPVDLKGSIASTGFHVLRGIEVEADWLLALVKSRPFVDAMSQLVQGALYPAVRPADVRTFEIPLPPLAEQRRIVAKIEAMQTRSRKARESLEAIPPLLDQFRQSVLAAAFRGNLTAAWREQHPDVEPAPVLLDRIRQERRRKWEEAKPGKKYVEAEPVDTSDLPDLPEGWCWARWSEVGFCQNGSAFPSKNYADEGVKLLRPGNLHVSGDLVWNAENTRYLPTEFANEYKGFLIGPNELVMNLTAQSLKDKFLGRICLSADGERCLLNQRLARITPVLLSPDFCLYLMKSPVFRKYVDDLNTGSLIQHMFTSQVYDFVFPLPPKEEQDELVRRIVIQLQVKDRLSELVAESVKDLPHLVESILAKAFRGELVPQDPDDEPASVLLERIRASSNGEPSNGTPKKKRRRTQA